MGLFVKFSIGVYPPPRAVQAAWCGGGTTARGRWDRVRWGLHWGPRALVYPLRPRQPKDIEMRSFTVVIAATLGLAASTMPAFAETWTLIVQPAPYSQNPPAYSAWAAYQQFSDLQSCLSSRMRLHYDLWDSDRDLSMRALAGVCRSDATGQIVTGREGADDEEW